MRIEKKASPINNVEQWGLFAGPKKKSQWKNGRSAKETAKAWLATGEPAIPEDLKSTLDSCKLTRDIVVEVANPELPIRFDSYSGEPRNADVAFTGISDSKTVAVTIESKADEPFGNKLKKELKEAEKTKEKKPKSNKLQRGKNLLASILGVEGEAPEDVLNLRYQLFTATAGTLAYAKESGADVAVLLVHVFQTSATDDKKLRSNDDDFNAFLDHLRSCQPEAGQCGQLAGPFHFPESDYISYSIPLYIGKVVTQ